VYGLSVRWSLAGEGGQARTGEEGVPGESRPATPAAEELAAQLRDYVQGTSLERFSGLPGLHLKVWRMRTGEEFEGLYVFATAQARQEFADRFRAGAADAPGSRMVGAPPVAIEPFEVVAVAEGGEGFVAGPGPGTA
jgi:hypothetical protein